MSITSFPISRKIIVPKVTPINVMPKYPIVVELARSSGAEILLLLTLERSSVLTLRWATRVFTISSSSSWARVTLLCEFWVWSHCEASGVTVKSLGFGADVDVSDTAAVVMFVEVSIVVAASDG